jgi:predicted enzyme related to lactoylglutathione lyase
MILGLRTAIYPAPDLGAAPLDPVTDVGDRIRVAAVIDPFGNRFGLIENPHFNAAAVR